MSNCMEFERGKVFKTYMKRQVGSWFTDEIGFRLVSTFVEFCFVVSILGPFSLTDTYGRVAAFWRKGFCVPCLAFGAYSLRALCGVT